MLARRTNVSSGCCLYCSSLAGTPTAVCWWWKLHIHDFDLLISLSHSMVYSMMHGSKFSIKSSCVLFEFNFFELCLMACVWASVVCESRYCLPLLRLTWACCLCVFSCLYELWELFPPFSDYIDLTGSLLYSFIPACSTSPPRNSQRDSLTMMIMKRLQCNLH